MTVTWPSPPWRSIPSSWWRTWTRAPEPASATRCRAGASPTALRGRRSDTTHVQLVTSAQMCRRERTDALKCVSMPALNVPQDISLLADKTNSTQGPFQTHIRSRWWCRFNLYPPVTSYNCSRPITNTRLPLKSVRKLEVSSKNIFWWSRIFTLVFVVLCVQTERPVIHVDLKVELDGSLLTLDNSTWQNSLNSRSTSTRSSRTNLEPTLFSRCCSSGEQWAVRFVCWFNDQKVIWINIYPILDCFCRGKVVAWLPVVRQHLNFSELLLNKKRFRGT